MINLSVNFDYYKYFTPPYEYFPDLIDPPNIDEFIGYQVYDRLDRDDMLEDDVKSALIMSARTTLSGKPKDKEKAALVLLRLQGFIE